MSFGRVRAQRMLASPIFERLSRTNTANGPLLTAHRDNSDSSNLSDVLDMEGNLLLRRLGSCYSPDDLPDDCFIARQGFDYGLMDSTGQWLYRESIFSSPSDDAGGGYLY